MTPIVPTGTQRAAVLTGVGIGDLIGLIWIQPDLFLTAAQDAGGQPLLEPEHAAAHTDSMVTTNILPSNIEQLCQGPCHTTNAFKSGLQVLQHSIASRKSVSSTANY